MNKQYYTQTIEIIHDWKYSINYTCKQTHDGAAISLKRNNTTVVRKWSNRRMISTLKLPRLTWTHFVYKT